MLKIVKVSSFPVSLSFFLITLLMCIHTWEAVGDDEIAKYEEILKQEPNMAPDGRPQSGSGAEAHKKLGTAYAKKGMIDEAIEEFERAMEIERKEGYERGKEDALRMENVRIYGRYIILSIVVGLFISAVIVSILSWPEMADRLRVLRKNARIKAFIRDIRARLTPELRDRAVEIAQRKEKLRDAISRETDSSLREAAAGILPRLDDLTKQASLLLELQQNLSDYIKDIDLTRLETAYRNCEEQLKKETDQEAKSALEYQLKQMRNKRQNYSKAAARIRTCDAVLKGIAARIDATSLDLMSLPSVLIRKQEFFEKVSAELDEEISLTRNATETVMEEST